MDSMLLSWYAASIIINFSNVLFSSMVTIKVLKNIYFLLLNILSLKTFSLLLNTLNINQLFKLESSKIIQNLMVKLAFVGVKKKTWNNNKVIYRVEKQKARIDRPSLIYIVRCEEILNDSTLASCRLTCNVFVRCYG